MARTETADKKILLCCWGNGNGHLSHCLALAKISIHLGWHVTIAITDNEDHRELIRAAGGDIYVYPGPLPQDLWQCWHDPDFFRSTVEADIGMICDVAPDVIVHDIRFSTPVAARLAGIPCASIGHGPLFSGFAYPKIGMYDLWTDGNQNVNVALSEYHLPLVDQDLRELLLWDEMLVPSFPEFDPPLRDIESRLTYIGPLNMRVASAAPSDDNSEAGEHSSLLFYRTVGQRNDLPGFLRTFGDLDQPVYVATGTEKSAAEMAEACQGYNVRIRALWDIGEIANRLRCIVHHGGPGTALACLEANLPSVMLTGDHPERWYYSVQFESQSVGAHITDGPSFETAWTAIESTGNGPRWTDVKRRVDQVCGDTKIASSVERWAARMRKHGPEVVARTLVRLADKSTVDAGTSRETPGS